MRAIITVPLAFCSGVSGGQLATAARTLARCVDVSQ